MAKTTYFVLADGKHEEVTEQTVESLKRLGIIKFASTSRGNQGKIIKKYVHDTERLTRPAYKRGHDYGYRQATWESYKEDIKP